MDNLYNDEQLPENFEQIAKAYSKSLKDKGFVFVRLKDEEFNLLLNEVHVLIAKMQACLARLEKKLDAQCLKECLSQASQALSDCFGKKRTDKFKCLKKENESFLSLISLENLLIIKLMLLSVKSGELELCNTIITSISGVFAESFSIEGFLPEE